MKRDNKYLEEKLYEIWENHFSDVPRKNLVLIKFGKYSKRQLGSIKWAQQTSKIKNIYNKYVDDHKIQDDKRITIITITRYFRDDQIPEELIYSTIAHELAHYSHGFHSPLPRIYNHPHKGNIVNKELVKRGIGQELNFSEKWLKTNWLTFLKSFRPIP